MKIMIATIREWNIRLADSFKERYQRDHDIRIITRKDELEVDAVAAFAPDLIFLPHWSFYIPPQIVQQWECVVFHMTDLPYGRGGSPLQNLIVRGHKDTMISAIRVTEGLDCGPVYMKHALSLEGSAQEIYERCSGIIFHEMIPAFLTDKPVPVPQEGEPVVFKRRKPEESRLTPDMGLETLYDHIRMLDAQGYPRAYIRFGGYKLTFEAAERTKEGGALEAKVIFTKVEDQDEDSFGSGGASG